MADPKPPLTPNQERSETWLTAAIATFGLVFPIIVMTSCSGWNEGTMHVASCAVPFGWWWALADWFYGAMLLSAFLAFIPVLVYLGLLIVLSRWLARLILR